MNQYPRSKYNSYEEYRYEYAEHIVKTMKLLFFQFVFTFGSVFLVTLLNPIHLFFEKHLNEMIIIPGILTLLVFIHITLISQKMTIEHLCLLTVCQTISICGVTTFYGPDIVIMAMLFTGGISAALAMYALLTKNNYSNCMGFLLSILSCLIFMGTLNLFIRSSMLHNLVLYVGTLLFFSYIVVDVQYFLTENMCKELEYHDNLHIVAAVNIYLDVVNIFLRMLQIINKLNKSNSKR